MKPKTVSDRLSSSLTKALQVWIPKIVFSTFVTLSSSKLRTTGTLPRHLDTSQLQPADFSNNHLLLYGTWMTSDLFILSLSKTSGKCSHLIADVRDGVRRVTAAGLTP